MKMKEFEPRGGRQGQWRQCNVSMNTSCQVNIMNDTIKTFLKSRFKVDLDSQSDVLFRAPVGAVF